MTAVFEDAEARMKGAVETLRRELAGLRAGRASPALLDRVRVDYYGAQLSVNQLATITVPEPRLLVIQPWDKTQTSAIEKAILKADLGLVPSSDGQVIRLVVPQLTEERRRELVRTAHRLAEEARVAVRNVRRDANDVIRELARDGDVSEDEAGRAEERIQKLTDRYVQEIGRLLAQKEAEIAEV
ncbi:MAG: ribosome recycling factor [Clostridia bacterium]|nr:ribosome recycling factor [Clostridia bacterium]